MIKSFYIKCNSFKESFALDSSLKKGLLLLHCKHLFCQHRINNESINWKCKMAKDKDIKCGCTITVGMNDDILSCGKHSDRCLE